MKKLNISQKYAQFVSLVKELKNRYANNGEVLAKIDENTTKVKDAFITKGLTIALTIAMLTGMVACENSNTNQPSLPSDSGYSDTTPGTQEEYRPSEGVGAMKDDNGNYLFPPEDEKGALIIDIPSADSIVARPLEEIQQSTITPQDVLANLDLLAIELTKAFYGNPNVVKQLGKENYDNLTASFVGITPTTILVPNREEQRYDSKQLTFYAVNPYIDPSHIWFRDETNPYYIEGVDGETDVVPISLAYIVDINNFPATPFAQNTTTLIINEDKFHDLFVAYGIQPVQIDDNFLDNLTYGQYKAKESYGLNAYNPKTFTRKVIEESTEEQLWALYHVIEDIKSLNLYPSKTFENNLE